MRQAYNDLLASGFPDKRKAMRPAKNKREMYKVYDSIAGLSRRLPFYIIDLSGKNREYVIEIKQTALKLKEKLEGMQDLEAAGFQSRAVSVSDESLISARLLKEDTGQLPDTIKIKIIKLANGQLNRGKELMKDSFAFPAGEYEFNANVMEETYPLTYVHGHRMSNQDSLMNIADFITRNVPGVDADVEEIIETNYSRIMLASDQSGRFGDRKFSFDEEEVYGEGVVDFFGLNRVEREASYSDFELNGIRKRTPTNTFTLEDTLYITLKSADEKPAILRITPDSSRILITVDSVLSTYNDIIKLAKDRSDTDHDYSASRLISEMKNIEKAYLEELMQCGIKIKEDGTLQIDDLRAVQAAEDGYMESFFTNENGFMTRLIDKSKAIAINPAQYMEKTVVLYPNGRNLYRNPYVTSMYSGMLFSSYC